LACKRDEGVLYGRCNKGVHGLLKRKEISNKLHFYSLFLLLPEHPPLKPVQLRKRITFKTLIPKKCYE
jgi:hypothetical protein